MWPTYGYALAGGGGETAITPQLPIVVEVEDIEIVVEVDTR